MSRVRNSLIILFFSFSAIANESTLYVQAVKATLRSEPQMGANGVAQVSRGAVVTEVAREGQWIKVKWGKAEGWISKFFLTTFKPVGQAKLLEDLAETDEKASRRRPASRSVAAATRGGFEKDRVRGDREMYRSDFEALEALEEKLSAPEDLEGFIKEGQLAQ